MASPSKTLDWAGVKGQLRQIFDKAPRILSDAVLIGGAACLAYRSLLSAADDPDFQAPSFTALEEQNLLSKDVDFANLDAETAALAGDMPIGRLQFGVRLGSEEFRDGSRPLRLTYDDGVAFSVSIADPLDLYREKDAAAAKLGRPQDRLHLAILAVYVKLELAILAERATVNPAELSEYGKFRSRCKDYAIELFNDFALRRRLAPVEGKYFQA